MQKTLHWLENHWMYTPPFLAALSLSFIFAFKGQMDMALFLIWLQTSVYFLHQTEEYILPGGFLAFFNNKMLGSDQPEFPVSKAVSLWINGIIIFIAFPGSAILSMHVAIWMGLWAAYFSLLNGLSHVVMFFKFGYNPGLAVSLVLNIPVGAYTIWYFVANQVVSLNDQLVSLAIALAVQIGMMIYGFLILKPRIGKR